MTRKAPLPLTSPKPLPTPLAMSATTSGPTPSPLPVRPSSKDRESTPEKDDIGSEYVIDAFF